MATVKVWEAKGAVGKVSQVAMESGWISAWQRPGESAHVSWWQWLGLSLCHAGATKELGDGAPSISNCQCPRCSKKNLAL